MHRERVGCKSLPLTGTLVGTMVVAALRDKPKLSGTEDGASPRPAVGIWGRGGATGHRNSLGNFPPWSRATCTGPGSVPPSCVPEPCAPSPLQPPSFVWQAASGCGWARSPCRILQKDLLYCSLCWLQPSAQ